MTDMSGRYRAVFALLITVSIWGTTFVATKLALRDVQPLTLTLARFILGTAVLLPLAWSDFRSHRSHLPWGQLALAGLFGGCLFFALQNLGLASTTASKASLIQSSVPALIALLSVPILKERIGLERGAGVAASMLGVAIIVIAGDGSTLAGGTTIGDIIMLGCALSWAAYTIEVKGLEGRVSPLVLSTASVGFGALFMIPFAGYELVTQAAPALTITGGLAIAYLGLVASAAPFLLWNFAISQLDASEAATYINLVPVVAVVSAVVLLEETLLPVQLAGAVLVLGGVWIASKQRVSSTSVTSAR